MSLPLGKIEFLVPKGILFGIFQHLSRRFKIYWNNSISSIKQIKKISQNLKTESRKSKRMGEKKSGAHSTVIHKLTQQTKHHIGPWLVILIQHSFIILRNCHFTLQIDFFSLQCMLLLRKVENYKWLPRGLNFFILALLLNIQENLTSLSEFKHFLFDLCNKMDV